MRLESARTDARPDPRIDDDRAAGETAGVEQLHAEIARLRAECETLRWFVGHDELTSLANRRLFSQLAPARLRASTSTVVLLLDLNGFKPINDAYGHEAGDHVLRVVAQRLKDWVGDGLIARLGGDEFVGVLTPTDSDRPAPTWWIAKVTGLLDALEAPMTIAGRPMSVTASIGVAVADATDAIGDLMHRADIAMYEAKIHGLGYRAWQPESASTRMMTRIPHVRPPADSVPAPRAKHGPATDPPTIDPYRRDPADIAPAGTYQPADPVWVYRHGAWYPGVVESASRRAVMATYRRNVGAGTVVDTMGAECVLERTDADPHLDQIHTARIRPVA